MARYLIFSLCCIFATVINDVASEDVAENLTVKLKHGGSLVGTPLKSNSGRGIAGYFGIPYAKPPIGKLRFSAPLPADAWKGVRMATTDGNACSQIDVFGGTYKYSGDEDCLYLNVYVPETPKTTGQLPVMVWIPGGGFIGGDGTLKSYNPKLLLDYDVILVSINYRLSTLGFLSSETVDMSGNWALKDQLMALKWVKRHISAFGGDDNNITIFGESAGSISVTYLTLSDKTKGLFNRAIASSGSFYNSWAKPSPKGVAASKAIKIAKSVGCGLENSSWKSTLNCLRSVPARNLTEASLKLLVWDYAPMPPLSFVIEPQHKDAFLTHSLKVTPYSNSLPMLIGFNKDEGALFLLMHLPYYANFEQFRTQLETHFPDAFSYPYINKANEEFVKEAITEYYFGDAPITKCQNLTNAFTDSAFLSGIDEHIRHRLSRKYPAAPTYLYQFEHKGEISNSYAFGKEFEGVCHGDDLFYIFPSGETNFPMLKASKRDQEVSQYMLEMWYNFAATGNPTPGNTNLPKWSAISSYPPQSMRIGSMNADDSLLEMTSEYPTSRANFWRKLQPYLESDSEKQQNKEICNFNKIFLYLLNQYRRA